MNEISYDDGRVTIRPTRLHDICFLKDRLRREDRMEIWSARHLTPEKDLLICYLESDVSFTACDRGIPILMFGVVSESLLGGPAVVWLLGTYGVDQIKKTFVVQSRRVIQRLLERYQVLYNFVDARYTRAIRWLKWCGAKLEEAKPQGEDKLPFHFFTFERKVG